MREVTKGTRFECLVRDHMFHKLRLRLAFPDHLQLVAMLALLDTPGVKCVLRAGDHVRHALCDATLWQTYDPCTVHPNDVETLPFKPFPRNLLTGRFGTLSFDSRVRAVKVANSGDELQGYAGLQFVPYLSDTVDRDSGLKNASCNLFGNAWWGTRTSWPPRAGTNMTLFSVHFSSLGKSTIAKSTKWMQEYNRKVGPVGARDFGTMAFLDSIGIESYFSGCFTTMIDMGYQKSPTPMGYRNEPNPSRVVVVDVEEQHLPEHVRKSGIFKHANIPSQLMNSTMERFLYAFQLLKLYSKTARLVVTSRIHAALPALAQGKPVVFVLTDHLPGGGGGRTAGLTKFFHVYDKTKPQAQWPVDLDHPQPNPGNHEVDRYRAQFWHYIAHFLLRNPEDPQALYAQTGRLFGVVPLQRLGAAQPTEYPTQSLFHFIVTTGPNTMNWRIIRAIEQVFYHHPNAKVLVHSNTLVAAREKGLLTGLEIFTEVGYNLEVVPFKLLDLAAQCLQSTEAVNFFVNKSYAKAKNHRNWYSHETDLLRTAILCVQGGVYLDTDMHLVRPLPKSMRNVLALQGRKQVNGAMLIFDQGSEFMRVAVTEFLTNYRTTWSWNGPNLLQRVANRLNNTGSFTILGQESFYPFRWQEVLKCWNSTEPYEARITNHTYAVHLNTGMSKHIQQAPRGSVCHKIMSTFCIFCHILPHASLNRTPPPRF